MFLKWWVNQIGSMQNKIKLEAAHLINAEHNIWVIVACRDI
jgi:hypothetical protein